MSVWAVASPAGVSVWLSDADLNPRGAFRFIGWLPEEMAPRSDLSATIIS
jgi:hypothetical protein